MGKLEDQLSSADANNAFNSGFVGDRYAILKNQDNADLASKSSRPKPTPIDLASLASQPPLMKQGAVIALSR